MAKARHYNVLWSVGGITIVCFGSTPRGVVLLARGTCVTGAPAVASLTTQLPKLSESALVPLLLF
jgi:hypothetical protein